MQEYKRNGREQVQKEKSGTAPEKTAEGQKKETCRLCGWGRSDRGFGGCGDRNMAQPVEGKAAGRTAEGAAG